MSNFIPTDEQWEKMKKHIKGDKYKKEDFFVFETLAVGDKIVPNRYMKLTPALLDVMREDAQKGVSLMLNHNWSQEGVQSIPIGKVFDGRLAGGSQEGETTTLYTTQYILRDDSKVDGYSKNDIINLIESGILSDTSVGWGTTRDAYKCSICGNSIHDWRKCEHIPGRKYIVNEETNEVKECIVEANPPAERHSGNNVLMENSVVFDGAYPNAIIQSKYSNNENDKSYKSLSAKEDLSEEDIIIGYATNGSINLLYKKSDEKGGVESMDENENNATITNPTSEQNQDNTTNNTNAVDNVDNSVETSNVETNIDAETTENLNNEVAVETNSESDEAETNNVDTENTFTEKEILEKFGNICDSLDNLVELAKEGLENRNIVIQEALNSGIHSMGNMFNKDIFTKTFANMKTKDIQEMGKAWEEQAKASFSDTKVSKTDSFSKQGEEQEFKINMNQFKTLNY